MATISQITPTTNPADADATAPLHFELNTNPDPVRVSPASGDPQRADFVLVGSRRSSLAIDCRKITITVATGNKSPDLTPDLNSVTPQISLPDWTAATDPAAKTITFTPTSDHATIAPDQGITIQLMGMRINTEVGSAPLRIDVEWAESGDDYWDTGRTVIDVGKFPADFVLRNFIPEDLVIDNGGSVKLNWETTGASSLKLLYDVADVNVLGHSTWTVNNIRYTTVFYLRATVQNGTDTVERILSATVTVRIPDLEVRNLVVNGDLTAVTDGTIVRIAELQGPEKMALAINSNVKILKPVHLLGAGDQLYAKQIVGTGGTAPRSLRIDGNVTINGDLTATGEINS